MLSIGADGQIQYNQLKLGGAPRETYTVRDEMWYDPASHRFAHTVSLEGRVLFANAYDGRSLHLLELDPQGNPRIKDEPVAKGAFQPPSGVPPEFLGIFSFVKTSKPSPGRNTTFRDEGPTRLADGGPAHVVRLSSTASEGNPMSQAHFLVTIRDRDHVVESIACVFQGHKLYTVRRAQVPVPREPQCGWDLAGLRSALEKDKDGAKSPVQTLSDLVRPSITVEQMLKAADYPVYVLDRIPHWTLRRQIMDVLDLPSPPHRMFAAVYPARDKRHVVLIQAHSFNEAPRGRRPASGKLVYTSPAGIKVWSDQDSQKMAEVLLASTRAAGLFSDPMAKDRTCYLLETPEGTFPALAVNGALTDAELHGLANSLVPAKAK